MKPQRKNELDVRGRLLWQLCRSPPLPTTSFLAAALYSLSLSLILFLFFSALSRSPAASSAVFIRLKAIYSETFARKMQTLPASLCSHPSLAYSCSAHIHTHTNVHTRAADGSSHVPKTPCKCRHVQMLPRQESEAATLSTSLPPSRLLCLPSALPLPLSPPSPTESFGVFGLFIFGNSTNLRIWFVIY